MGKRTQRLILLIFEESTLGQTLRIVLGLLIILGIFLVGLGVVYFAMLLISYFR